LAKVKPNTICFFFFFFSLFSYSLHAFTFVCNWRSSMKTRLFSFHFFFYFSVFCHVRKSLAFAFSERSRTRGFPRHFRR
jgi:hypothetical protein